MEILKLTNASDGSTAYIVVNKITGFCNNDGMTYISTVESGEDEGWEVKESAEEILALLRLVLPVCIP